MSMCDCNQGRLPCTCKPIEGATVMSDISISTGHPDAGRVYAEALDRLTAECKALQERLNAADQKDDDLSFQLKDREGSRRDWFEEAQAAEKRVEVLEQALRFYADGEHYHFESGNWDTVSGEPLNILWCGDEPDFIEDGTVARTALSASAEPGAPKCETCQDHGEIGGLRPDGYDSEPCPDCAVPKCGQCGARAVETCNDNGCAYLENGNGAPVERDERAEFETWARTGIDPLVDGDFRWVDSTQTYYWASTRSMWVSWQARAALSASAEPSVRCHGCEEEGVKADHFDEAGKCIAMQAPVERDLDDDPFFVQQAEPNSSAVSAVGGDQLHHHLAMMIGQAEYMLELAENSHDPDFDENDGQFEECREYIKAAQAAMDKATEGASHE